jgi:hypothetical protein
MFSALKTSIYLLGYEKYIKIQRGNAVYFKHVKICGITFGVSWRKRPFPPDSTKNFHKGGILASTIFLSPLAIGINVLLFFRFLS